MPTFPSAPPSVPARQAGGFTLIELLIASLIAIIILGVSYYLFGQVQKGVRTSLSRAQVSSVFKGLDARLRIDFAGLAGPNNTPGSPAGALVIVPGFRQGYLPKPNGQMSTNQVRLRADQLVFLSKTDLGNWLNAQAPNGRKWTGLLPTNQNDPSQQKTSAEARLWYGPLINSTLAGGNSSVGNPATWAHNWLVGRQCKLIAPKITDINTGIATPAPAPSGTDDLTLTGTNDWTTLYTNIAALADAACGRQTLPGGGAVRGVKTRTPTLGVQAGADWTEDQYIANLGAKKSAGYPLLADADLPAFSPAVDLKALQQMNTISNSNPAPDPVGAQWSDIQNTQMLLLENCSEIVVQWAGDLDKDGQIDFYPPGHPLAGSIIWYPEEYHDKGTWYNATAAPRLSGWNATPKNGIGATYSQAQTNPWTKAFPNGFQPDTLWRFGGNGITATHPYPAGFQFDWNEQDGAASGGLHGPTTASVNAPSPFVFRFDDDQYRLARFGFRQDGSVYANKHDTFKPLPGPIPAGSGAPGSSARHWFPYPPTALAATSSGNQRVANPPMTDYYGNQVAANQKAPDGPYPRNGTAADVAGENFGDLMGDQYIPQPGQPAATIGVRQSPPPAWPAWSAGAYAAQSLVTSGGALYYASAAAPLTDQPGISSPSVWVQVPLSVSAWAGGTCAPNTFTAYGANNAWYYTPSSTAAAPNAAPWVALTSSPYGFQRNVTQTGVDVGNAAVWALGSEIPFVPGTTDPFTCYAQKWANGNNWTVTYLDLWAEWLNPVNAPALQGTHADWRNPQSDWPQLIRIRLRLHDRQGLVTSYSDEALINGRDDDGDGVVDNPEEGRICGVWYEFITAVPSPKNLNPRNNGGQTP